MWMHGALRRARSRFANVWQISDDFANVWQNAKTARRMDLPMFGKFGPILPNIGKMPRRTACRAGRGFGTVPFHLRPEVAGRSRAACRAKHRRLFPEFFELNPT